MEAFQVFLIILFSGGVFSHDPYGSLSDNILIRCNSDDIICLRKSTEKFLEATHMGLPILNIQPIDPIIIPVIFMDGGNINVRNQLSDVVVKGFKDTFISDFKLNKVSKTIEISTLPLLNVIGRLTVYMGSSPAVYHGTFNLTGSAFAKVTNDYAVRTDTSGTEHLEIGPETIICKTMRVPDLGLDYELLRELENDNYVKTISKNQRAALRSKVFCEVVKEVLKVQINNVRKAFKILSVSSLFRDSV